MTINFSADSLEGFLISSSMVGLGLVIAIYSITLPQIQRILKRQFNKLNSLMKKRDEIFNKLSKDKDNSELNLEFQDVQDKIKTAKKLPFHIDTGYQISGGCFTFSLLVPLIKLLAEPSIFLDDLLAFSVGLFTLGIVVFIIVWFYHFVEFRSYATEELQKIIDVEEKDKKELEMWWEAHKKAEKEVNKKFPDFKVDDK